MTWEAPGSRQWSGTQVGLTAESSKSDATRSTVIRFDDGVIWHMLGGAWGGTRYVTPGLSVMEKRPDSPVWESLTADLWTDVPGPFPSSNKLIDVRFGIETNSCAVEGSDTNWACAISDDEGDRDVWCWSLDSDSEGGLAWGIVVMHRDSRTFSHYDWPSSNTPKYYPDTFPVFSKDYVYWVSNAWSGRTLVRTRRDSPGSMEVVNEWGTDSNRFLLNSATGLPRGLNSSIVVADDIALAIDGDWIYILEGNTSRPTGSSNYNYGAIRRIRAGSSGASVQNLYVHVHNLEVDNKQVTSGSFNFPDGTFSYSSGGLPTGTGLQPAGKSQARIKDGWLYWIDRGAVRDSVGFYFCRIDLNHLLHESGLPIRHDPATPRYEILSDGSGAYDGWGRWGSYRSDWRIGHREGYLSLHGTYDLGWSFEEDGSIVFGWEAFPNYNDQYYPVRILSRLSPTFSVNVTIKFEGNALRGYANAREVPALFAQEEIWLS